MNFEQEPKPESKPAPGGARTSGLAIASLAFGILSFCLLPLLGTLLALTLGIVALVKISGSEGKLRGIVPAALGMAFGGLSLLMLPCMIALLLPAVQAAREAARRKVSMDNMRMLGMSAMHHEMSHRVLPPAGRGPNGEEHNMSWRVIVLPYLEEESLYRQLREAGENGRLPRWDDPAIAPLVAQMPNTFRNPNQHWAPNETNYLAVTGPETIYDPQQFPRGPSRTSISDGESQTIWLVEADAEEAVPWQAPRDWEFDPANPTRGLGKLRMGGFLVLYADGHTQFISSSADPEVIRALMTARGREVVDPSAASGSFP